MLVVVGDDLFGLTVLFRSLVIFLLRLNLSGCEEPCFSHCDRDTSCSSFLLFTCKIFWTYFMFLYMFYLLICQYLTLCVSICYFDVVDVSMLVPFELFNCIFSSIFCIACAVLFIERVETCITLAEKYSWSSVNCDCYVSLILTSKDYCIWSIFAERSTSRESQQADFNQDTTALLLLFSPILQAWYNSWQCWKPWWSSSRWPHWELSIYGLFCYVTVHWFRWSVFDTLGLLLLFFLMLFFQFEMREPQMCQIVCKITVGEKEAKLLKEKIEDEYRVNMYVNNLASWFLTN